MRIDRIAAGEVSDESYRATTWSPCAGVEVLPIRPIAPLLYMDGDKVTWIPKLGPRLQSGAAIWVLLFFALAQTITVACAATPVPPGARLEIDGLLTRLEQSGCEFSRNGGWYTGAEAKLHLLRKLQYLEERGAVQTAEQFIELAATSSSMSGQPYLVRCRNGAPVASATWLRTQLEAMRKSVPAKRAP